MSLLTVLFATHMLRNSVFLAPNPNTAPTAVARMPRLFVNALNALRLVKTSASAVDRKKDKEFNYKIGKLTEYFKFDEVETLLLDLHQMKPKILEQVELDILDGSLSFPLILQPDLI